MEQLCVVLPVEQCTALRSWTPSGPSYTPSHPGTRGCSGSGGNEGRRPWSLWAGVSSGSAGTGPAPQTPVGTKRDATRTWGILQHVTEQLKIPACYADRTLCLRRTMSCERRMRPQSLAGWEEEKRSSSNQSYYKIFFTELLNVDKNRPLNRHTNVFYYSNQVC